MEQKYILTFFHNSYQSVGKWLGKFCFVLIVFSVLFVFCVCSFWVLLVFCLWFFCVIFVFLLCSVCVLFVFCLCSVCTYSVSVLFRSVMFCSFLLFSVLFCCQSSALVWMLNLKFRSSTDSNVYVLCSCAGDLSKRNCKVLYGYVDFITDIQPRATVH